MKIGDTVIYLGGGYNKAFIAPGALGKIIYINTTAQTIQCRWDKALGDAVWQCKISECKQVDLSIFNKLGN